MLLPELSRSNRHGMAPSMSFFRGLYRRLTMRDRKKIFVIGFHKTGTTSLARALTILGYRVCGYVNPLEISAARTASQPDPVQYLHQTDSHSDPVHPRTRYYKILSPLLELYDVYQDTPWFMFYRELLEQFPDAKFILTVRPEEEWFRSVRKHFGGYNRKYFHWIYQGKGDPVGNRESYLRTYSEHNQSVIRYFHRKGKQLLVMRMPEDFKWEPLCEFLSCSKPFGSFPHANSAGSRMTLRRKMIDRVKLHYYKYDF